jgi:lipid II:glycine glycyltransferase (peptidoglycan interpeptide bridge formation enzyme)
MRKTTRYSIKKAEKDGVTISRSSLGTDIEQLYTVYAITAQRQHFAAFSKRYLQHELEAFEPAAKVQMFFAHYQNDIVATAMIIFSNGSAFYHHGASSQHHQKLTASYLLQWEAIKFARQHGCALYNFWGIAPVNKPKHPWAGLTLFKQGFGGFSEAYVPAYDLPLTSKYWFNFVIEYFRRIKRGL